jgi:hypothetical protein
MADTSATAQTRRCFKRMILPRKDRRVIPMPDFQLRWFAVRRPPLFCPRVVPDGDDGLLAHRQAYQRALSETLRPYGAAASR